MAHLHQKIRPWPTTADSDRIHGRRDGGIRGAGTANNSTVSPCPRIPHLGTELTGLFSRGRQANNAKRRAGLSQPPLHP